MAVAGVAVVGVGVGPIEATGPDRECAGWEDEGREEEGEGEGERGGASEMGANVLPTLKRPTDDEGMEIDDVAAGPVEDARRCG